MKEEVQGHKECQRCEWTWQARAKRVEKMLVYVEPKVCPNCHSPWFAEPRQKKELK
jgi:ssDNA-binding Zn-finger/Zn-ribbon topoisomerase 1